jgi:hypothetical protein
LIKYFHGLGLPLKAFFMKAIYATLYLSIIFSSCNKDYGTTTVEGKEVDVTTGKPVPYAKVLLQSHVKFSESGTGTEQEFTADAAGNFAFSFEAEKDKVYEADGYKQDLYFNAIDATNIEKGKKNKDAEVKLQPAGWLRFHLHDEAPVGNVESFHIQGFNFPPSVSINWPPIDPTFKVMTFGNIDKQFVYWLTINNEQIRTIDTVFCRALDTTDVYIKF